MGESERGSEVGRGGRARDLQPHYDVSRNCAAKKRKTLFYDIGCHFVEGGEGRRVGDFIAFCSALMKLVEARPPSEAG